MFQINNKKMLENEEKKSYGAYSTAGKNSAELFTNIRKKDSILYPHDTKKNKLSIINFLKRNGYHNIYGDDTELKHYLLDELDESQLEEVEEEIDIFKMQAKKNLNKNSVIKKTKKINENEPNYFHRLNKEYYKFHDLRRQKGIIVKPDTTPTCTKYVPSKKLVWKRVINWPEWEKMKGRKKLFEGKDGKFYINHGEILTQVNPCFIEMEKQTMRGNCVPSTHYLRVITTKPFKQKHKPKIQKKNLEIEIQNDFFTFGKKEENEKVYNNRYANEDLNKNWNSKKRDYSALTSSTRPQTGKPSNLRKFGSRPMTSTQTATFSRDKKITSVTNTNTNKSHISSKSMSNDGENSANIKEKDNTSNNSSELNDSYYKFENIYRRQIKKRAKNKNNKKVTLSEPKSNNLYTFNNKNKNILIKTTETNSSISKSQKNPKTKNQRNRPNSMYQTRYIIHKKNIKAPDFNKIISREYYFNLADKGATLIPFSLPNFKQVRERPLSLVSYELPKHKKRKINYLQGIEPSMYNDHYKYIEFINNHVRCVPPNLEKMLARPKDDGSPLPVYMKGCVSREACNIMTERSLKMNNFAEGKFRSNYTSFWPKTSFNKIINLNILNSETFLSNLVGGGKNLKMIGNNMQKSIKYYNRNFKELMKEGMLTKFDNITFKTIRPNNKIESKELDKFLQNYEIDKKKDLSADIEKKILEY